MDKIIFFIAASLVICMAVLLAAVLIRGKKRGITAENEEDDRKNYIICNIKFFEKKFLWIKVVIIVLTYFMDKYNPKSYYLLIGVIVFIFLEIETQILAFGLAGKKIALRRK